MSIMALVNLKLLNGGLQTVDTNNVVKYMRGNVSSFVELSDGTRFSIELDEWDKLDDVMNAPRR